MKFWDASALVPLLIDEPPRESLLAMLERDRVILAWWGSAVECTSAISRRERDGSLEPAVAADALQRLRALARQWQEILPSEVVRAQAQRLLRVHPLRAANSLQLAAALVAAEHQPQALDFVCLDERLNDAARREGFEIIRG